MDILQKYSVLIHSFILFISDAQLTQPVIAVNVPPHLDPHQRQLWGIPSSPHHLFGYSVQNAYGLNPFAPPTVNPSTFTQHVPQVVHETHQYEYDQGKICSTLKSC